MVNDPFRYSDLFLQLREVRPLVKEDKFSQSLQEGLCLHYDDGVTFCFNRTFSGSRGCDQLLMTEAYRVNESYSLEFRPDIAIGYSGKWLLLDAKNKGESGFYGEEKDGLIGACKPEDLYKMHTYRDALVDVVGAFVLYPGDQIRQSSILKRK